MEKKPLKWLAAAFLIAIICFVNTRLVTLSYRDEPGDFGIESAQRYSVMCVYVLFPIFCENHGRQKNGSGFYLTKKRVYSYWVYLVKGDKILNKKEYFNQTFYCYNENKKRKPIEKENYGIACSPEYKEIFR